MTTRRVMLTPTGTHDPNTGNTMDIGSSSQATFSGVVRSILDNKWKLSDYKCNDFVVTIPSKPSEHPSVTEGFGYWYSCDLTNFNTSAVVSKIYVTDGKIPNNYTASAYSTTKNRILFRTNIFTLMADDAIEYSLDINTQQYHNDSYTDAAHVPFYDCDRGTLPYTDITYNLIVPVVNATLQSNGNIVDNPLTVTWTTNVQDFYSIVVNGMTVGSGINSTRRTYEIPSKYLVLGENTVTVKCENRTKIYDGATEYAEGNKVVKINLSTATPTLSNISLQNDNMLIDNVTTIRWKSTWQNKVNFYVDDVLKHTLTSNTLQELQLPVGFFREGSNALKVEVVKNQVSTVANTMKTVDNTQTYQFSRIKPTVTNIAVSGTNRDRVNTLKYDCTNYTKYNVYINDKLYESGNPLGPTNNEVIIQPGSLAIGKNKIKVEILFDTFEKVYANATIDIIATQDYPEIYSIEPSSINVNIENSSLVTFATNEFCDRWEMALNGVNRWYGTAERAINTAKSTFLKGNNRLTLTSYYMPRWSTTELRTSIKEVEFVGYGKPELPRIDATSVYNTATPTFEWECGKQESDIQVAYQIKVMGTGAVEEKIVNTSNGSHTITETLNNNTEYTVMVSIKNKFDIWSDWSAKLFRTSFNELPKPNLNLTVDRDQIVITIKCAELPNFKEIKLYRELGEGWVEIAHRIDHIDQIVDYAVPTQKQVSYKARIFDREGGFAESDVYTTKVKLDGYRLTSLDNPEESMKLNILEVEFEPITKEVLKQFAGSAKPRIYGDGLGYEQGKGTIAIMNHSSQKVIDFIQSHKLFCYRDWRGKKLYCFVKIVREKYESTHKTLPIVLTEVQFEEDHMYKGSLPEPVLRKVVYSV